MSKLSFEEWEEKQPRCILCGAPLGEEPSSPYCSERCEQTDKIIMRSDLEEDEFTDENFMFI